ncbi:hypothetical protein D3C76_1796720 [compost metagenome]
MAVLQLHVGTEQKLQRIGHTPQAPLDFNRQYVVQLQRAGVRNAAHLQPFGQDARFEIEDGFGQRQLDILPFDV